MSILTYPQSGPTLAKGPGRFLRFLAGALLNAALLIPALLLISPTFSLASQEQDPEIKRLIEMNLPSQVIDVPVPLPKLIPPAHWRAIVAKERVIERRRPDTRRLIGMFLEGDYKTEKVKDSPYGPGTIYTDQKGHTLEVFARGFVYHVARDLIEPVGKKKIVLGPDKVPAYQLDEKGNPIYIYAFDEKEALRLARQYVEQNFTSLADQGDIRTVSAVDLKSNPDKVAIVDFTRQFLGVPLLDEQIRVVLDGKKQVVTLSYFWSERLTPSKKVTRVMGPELALKYARQQALEAYQGEPPLMTLFNMRLGYILHRASGTLRPVWLMDLRYNRPEVVENPTTPEMERDFGAPRYARSVKQVVIYFAVEATRPRSFPLD